MRICLNLFIIKKNRTKEKQNNEVIKNYYLVSLLFINREGIWVN